jgi:hypothetical protein
MPLVFPRAFDSVSQLSVGLVRQRLVSRHVVAYFSGAVKLFLL